ncbi:MAG: hypothetical protein ACEQSR_05310 [Candidatus Methylacidiphilales bacterium]
MNKNCLGIFFLFVISFLINNRTVGQDLLITTKDDSIACELVSVDSLNYHVLVVYGGDIIKAETYLKTNVKKLISDYKIYQELPTPSKTDTVKKFSYKFTDLLAETLEAERVEELANKNKFNLFDYRFSVDYMNTIRIWGSNYIFSPFYLSGLNLGFSKSFGPNRNRLLDIDFSLIGKSSEKENDLIVNYRPFGKSDTLAIGTSNSLNLIACLGLSYSRVFMNKKRNNLFYLGGGLDFIFYSEYYRIQNYLIYLETKTIGYNLKFQYDRILNKNLGLGIGLRYGGGYLYSDKISIDEVLNTVFDNKYSTNSISRISIQLGIKYYLNKKRI